jgi:leader peptidase (prepilin peptidase) / N-methyltransferase
METLLYLIVFTAGLIVGSFLNCVIYRMEKGESFLSGRSYCPYCRHKLGFLDLVPVIGFLFLRGKCRYCREKISLQYPLVELLTGFIFLLIFYFQFPLGQFFFLLILSALLIIVFVYDLKHYLIPDKVVYSAIVLTFIYLIYSTFRLDHLWSALGLAGFFLAIVLISREKWMGMGDAKLGFLMGLLLGWPDVIVALFLAVFIGAIMGIGLIVMGKKGMKSEVPFGPFLVTGTFIALFWADRLINWYFNFFGYL